MFITPTEVSGDWYPEGSKKRVPEGVTVEQYVNAMIEVCEMYSIPVYDAFGKLGIYAKNSSQNSTYLTDGLHLNNNGHEVLGRGIYNFILGLSKTQISYYISKNAEEIPATGISLSKSNTSITVGETEQLTVTFTPSDATDKSLTWTTSDSSVATVSSTGLVTAISEGTATITAIATNNISDSCTYTVTALVNPWVGKTVTVNKHSGANSNASLTALFPMDSDFNKDNYIFYEINGINATNMISNSSLHTGGIFTDTTGEIANGAFVNRTFTGFYASNAVTGTNFVGTNTPAKIESTASTPYVKVAIPITGSPTYSFEITKLDIIVNGVKKIPTKLGAFFESDKEIITVE